MKKILAIFLGCLLLQGCWETQQGEKTGVIVKLSKQGVIIGTYEAQIIRGGMNSGSGSFGAPFDFTVEDKELLPIVREAMENQNPVLIKYHKEAITLWRAESDNYFLDSIEIVKDKK